MAIMARPKREDWPGPAIRIGGKGREPASSKAFSRLLGFSSPSLFRPLVFLGLALLLFPPLFFSLPLPKLLCTPHQPTLGRRGRPGGWTAERCTPPRAGSRQPSSEQPGAQCWAGRRGSPAPERAAWSGDFRVGAEATVVRSGVSGYGSTRRRPDRSSAGGPVCRTGPF